MSTSAAPEIPETDRILVELMDTPHIKGHRVDVLTVHDYVEGRDLDPLTVADRLGLDVADVHRALAYYHDHPRLMKHLREERSAEFEAFREQIDRPDGVSP